jgi:hypothetical protein
LYFKGGTQLQPAKIALHRRILQNYCMPENIDSNEKNQEQNYNIYNLIHELRDKKNVEISEQDLIQIENVNVNIGYYMQNLGELIDLINSQPRKT